MYEYMTKGAYAAIRKEFDLTNGDMDAICGPVTLIDRGAIESKAAEPEAKPKCCLWIAGHCGMSPRWACEGTAAPSNAKKDCYEPAPREYFCPRCRRAFGGATRYYTGGYRSPVCADCFDVLQKPPVSDEELGRCAGQFIAHRYKVLFTFTPAEWAEFGATIRAELAG